MLYGCGIPLGLQSRVSKDKWQVRINDTPEGGYVRTNENDCIRIRFCIK